MPWIFLTLMLANIVYFGWNFISTGQTPVRTLSAPVVQQGERIVLLHERKVVAEVVASPEGGAITEESPAVAVPEAVPVVQCFTVGPFLTSSDAFVARMKGKGFSVRVEPRKAEGKDYWIYVPPFTNRGRAEEKLSELKAKGVESFIVSEGRFVNAISLGHFSKKELAQSFRDKMTAAGIVVEYREMATEGTVDWVYVAPAASKSDLRSTIDAELSRNDSLRRQVAACEE